MSKIIQSNERRKHVASWCNGISQAVAIGGFVTPFFLGILDDDKTTIVSKPFGSFNTAEGIFYVIIISIIAAAFHFAGHHVLASLEQE